MRLFVNLLYNFKKSDRLSDLLAVLQQVLEENHWKQQRILFDFQDVNDAATENRTSHQKMLNAFPQMKPYWKSSYAEYCLHHLEPAVPPHSQSYISNFPGRRSGQPVFPAPDANINFALIKDIFAKIPRPYSFYSALVVLDGIDWTGTCDLSPAMDWINIYGKAEEDDWDAGYWPDGMYFDEICPFYQSNSVRIGKEWALYPEMTVQIEVFPGQGLEQARQVEAAFVKYFGTPAKRYTRAVHSWEDREAYHAKTRKMKEFFSDWSEHMEKECLRRQEIEIQGPSVPQKTVSHATLRRNFHTANGLRRYPLSRWDDACSYQKLLPHNYHLEVKTDLASQISGESRYDKQYHSLFIECSGCNFLLCGNFLVENFPAPDKGRMERLAVELWQTYLDRFEAEVVPKLFAVFGETPAEYICDSRKSTCANDDMIGPFGPFCQDAAIQTGC